jgi:hypothetical protein
MYCSRIRGERNRGMNSYRSLNARPAIQFEKRPSSPQCTGSGDVVAKGGVAKGRSCPISSSTAAGTHSQATEMAPILRRNAFSLSLLRHADPSPGYEIQLPYLGMRCTSAAQFRAGCSHGFVGVCGIPAGGVSGARIRFFTSGVPLPSRKL